MTDINSFSLLAPSDNCKYFILNDETINDLSLDFLVKNMTSSLNEQNVIKSILMNMPAEKSVIKYRQDIYCDLKNIPEVSEQLCEIFNEMLFYTSQKPKSIDNKSSIWELLSFLKELENYTSSIIKIKKIIDGIEFYSEGMKKFSVFINDIYNNSGFNELEKDLKNLGEDVSSIKSMTLGVNFTSDFFPEEIGIISMNEYSFGEHSLLKKFIGFHKQRKNNDKDLISLSILTHSHKGNAVESPLMNNLTTLVERMLPSVTAHLKKILKKYTDTSGTALSKLSDEFLFYSRFIELENKLSKSGVPCCHGEFSENNTYLENFYNLKLAVYQSKEISENNIICNDLEFTKEHGILILTGPNRGGKTILTQAIGLVFLLFQQGVFVPCSSAKIRICDGIYTHFPADENKTVSLGRLGEESDRFRRICQTATAESLILFNESFSTTSHTESLYIAEDVIKYLCCLGARVCFNTHMYELAENAEKINADEKSVCGAVSIVMGQNNSERSYKIHYSKPDGKSYAHDIAYQYGITFEQLCSNMNHDKNIPLN